MHQVHHNDNLVTAALRVSTAAYGTARTVQEISVESIAAKVPDIPEGLLDDALDALDGAGLLRRRDQGRLLLNPRGKTAYEEGCVAEHVFGEPYIMEKYSPAVVHLIVRTPAGDERGGTGFIIGEPERAIITAKHVLVNNELLRVETRDGTVMCQGATQILLGPAGVDLAAIRAEIPVDIVPMRMELRDQGAVNLERVMVLGYPLIAGHEPALIPVNAEATTGVPTYGRTRRSLVLQRMTTPGYSGAPVLDKRGMVIGIIREEGGIDHGAGPGVFVLGTPAYYLREVFELNH
jgi:hypothetical protein